MKQVHTPFFVGNECYAAGRLVADTDPVAKTCAAFLVDANEALETATTGKRTTKRAAAKPKS